MLQFSDQIRQQITMLIANEKTNQLPSSRLSWGRTLFSTFLVFQPTAKHTVETLKNRYGVLTFVGCIYTIDSYTRAFYTIDSIVLDTLDNANSVKPTEINRNRICTPIHVSCDLTDRLVHSYQAELSLSYLPG